MHVYSFHTFLSLARFKTLTGKEFICFSRKKRKLEELDSYGMLMIKPTLIINIDGPPTGLY